MMLREAPVVMVPRAHGNGVAHAPLFETYVRPDGVGSATVTLSAWAGPLLNTSISKSTNPPDEALAGPYFLTERSVPAAAAMLVTAGGRLFAGLISVGLGEEGTRLVVV